MSSPTFAGYQVDRRAVKVLWNRSFLLRIVPRRNSTVVITLHVMEEFRSKEESNMTGTRRDTRSLGAIGGLIAFACLLTGCNDFAQQRMTSIRDMRDITKEGPPKPAPALAIGNAPSTSR